MKKYERVYFTAIDAAEYLGTTVGVIRNLVHQGRLPSYKPFGKLLFKKKDLDRIVEASLRGRYR